MACLIKEQAHLWLSKIQIILTKQFGHKKAIVRKRTENLLDKGNLGFWNFGSFTILPACFISIYTLTLGKDCSH